MIPYKTSKDYKRLKELLDEGKGIVVFYSEMSYTGIIKRECDIFYIKGKEPHNMLCVRCEDCKTSFEEKCKAYNIEFIEPNL